MGRRHIASGLIGTARNAIVTCHRSDLRPRAVLNVGRIYVLAKMLRRGCAAIGQDSVVAEIRQ